ncbi:MAG: carbohydrate kinase family protein [Anaerovoracaceae bacterium]|jgi:sugar/nucleoside kinase (ribokinase family)
MKRRAIAAGNVGIDISPIFPGGERTSMEEVFRPGEIVHVEGAEVHPGGGAINTGIGMNLFGVETTIAGRIGDDHLGEMLLQMIKDHGAPEALVKDVTAHTAYSVILAVPGMDRVILQNPGANDRFSGEDVGASLVKGRHLFHFGHPPSMEKMYLDDGKELADLFRRMREGGLVTSLDLCAVDPASPAGKQDWRKILKNVLPFVDFFLPSRSELAYMLGEDDSEEVEDLARISHDLGAGNVVIKMGKEGMYFSTGGAEAIQEVEEKLEMKAGTLDSWIDQRGIQPPYPIEKEVSGLGAGDTSIAAFLSALLREFSLEESLYLSAAEGALCVTAYDAFSGLVPFEDLLGPGKLHLKF